MDLSNDCHGSATGTVSTANSGGPDQFAAALVSGAGNTLTYVTASDFFGGVAVKSTVGGTAGAAYVTYTFTAVTTAYSRLYARFDTLPSANTRLIAFTDAAGALLRAGVYVDTAGHIITVNSVGSTVATSTAVITAGVRFRVEFDATGDVAAGVVTCRLYLNAQSSTASETLNNTGQLTGGTIGQIWVGSSDSSTTNSAPTFGSVRVNDAGPIGPITLGVKAWFAPGDVTTANAASGTTITVNKPANIQNGDWLVAYPYNQSSGGSFTATPSGWTSAGVVSARTAGVYRKLITNAAGEPASYAWTASATARWTGTIFRITDADPLTLFDVVGTEGTGTTTVVEPAVTATHPNDLLLTFTYSNNASTTLSAITLPGGLTDGVQVQTPNTTNTSTTDIAFKQLAASGSTGTQTFGTSPSAATMGGWLIGLNNIVIAMAGGGVLAATGQDTISPTVVMAGTGTLTVTGVDTIPATVTMTGGGTLVASPQGVVTAVVAMTGGGTLAASGQDTISSAIAMTGGGVLAVTPAATQVAAFLSLAPTKMFCAHRGGSSDWPEETLYAYSHAALWNPSIALEASVWQCSSGEYVLSHDQTTARVFGTNFDIPTTPWSTLQSLRTTVGNQPIARLSDMLAIWGGNRVIMVDNKGNQNNATLLNLLDSFGGNAWFIAKGFITATAWADAASARSYQSWGYGYSVDVPVNFPANQSHWTTLGLDYLATGSDWTTVLAYGKLTLAHIIVTPANATTAYGLGAGGLMVSGVKAVIPEVGVEAPDLVLAGGGTLSVTPLVTHPTAVTMAGVGVLAVVPTVTHPATVTLTGGGTLTVVGVDVITAAATMAGLATLTVTAQVGPPSRPPVDIVNVAVEPDWLRAVNVQAG